MRFLERHELIARMEWMLILGAALMSMILAPVILGAAYLLLLMDYTPDWDDVLRALVVMVTLSGAITVCVMRVGVMRRSAGMLFGLGCVGGFSFLVCTGGLYQALNQPSEALSAMFICATFGAVLSIPCGMLFGFFYTGMLAPTQKHLAAPAQDSLVHTARALAYPFLIAAAIATIAVAVIEGPYCVTFFGVLSSAFDYQAPEGTDIAWTRYLACVPLLLSALVLLLYAYAQERRLRLLRAALGRREPSAWVISDVAPNADAMPLTEADRVTPNKLLLQISGSDVYRHNVIREAIYVGIRRAPLPENP